MGIVRFGQCCAPDRHSAPYHLKIASNPLDMVRAHVHVGVPTSFHALVYGAPDLSQSVRDQTDVLSGDMAIGGPSYSPFLLTVMCAHAARFDQAKTGEVLISRARLLLGHEIHRPSCIPTVQALLQLSARDLACGFISQAWLYSGMAFRMVSDLGLHHSTAKIGMLRHLSAEDLEIRRRLFWSCYFWDKAISLYLGRMPVLPELPFGRSPELCKSPCHRFAVDPGVTDLEI